MRNATRVFLVVLLFALAIWSVASVKAVPGDQVGPRVGLLPVSSMSAGDDVVAIGIGGERHCAGAAGIFATSAPAMATPASPGASNIAGRDDVPASNSLYRL